MIPLWLTAAAFCSVAYLTSSRTYAVLALSAIVNIYIDHFTHAADQYLMVTYSLIEFFTCLAILHYGDANKLYQSIMLALMLALHFIMEASLIFDYVGFIESGIYTYGMSVLIIAQLIGAGRGMDILPWTDSYRRETYHSGLFNHQECNSIGKVKK